VKEAKAILLKVKNPVIKMLEDLLTVALEDAVVMIANQRDAVPVGSPDLRDEKEKISQRFVENIAENLDELLGESSKDLNILNYGSLSLVDEDDLEAIIAMEGMVAHARNCDIQEYIGFTTRLDSMFFGTRIDESNNPMDPEKIGDAFQEAMRPVELTAKNLLIVFRKFNARVFHGLENVLAKANAILIEHGVIPSLDIAARDKAAQKNKRSLPRKKTDTEEQTFSENAEPAPVHSTQTPELFSLMQNLLHGAGTTPTTNQQAVGLSPSMVPVNQIGMMANQQMAPVGLQPGMLVGGQQVQMVMPNQLMEMLTEVQGKLLTQGSALPDSETPANLSIIQSLGENLEKNSADGAVRAIDSQSSDVINLVALLYDAIWQDDTVAIPIKELIGRTQISVMKVALTDATFFNEEKHPARMFLNEFAAAGLSWTKVEKLDKDPMYCKMQELVSRLVSEFSGEMKLFEELLQEFAEFKQHQMDEDDEREKRILEANERQERIEDI
jgi:hypothetical protein